ncbi:uncharacterized protein TNCV_4290671 [Trichonephila clavipes]|nr:uncharacterized protein TNCV_4290671 [Trichonephila clavipes]
MKTICCNWHRLYGTGLKAIPAPGECTRSVKWYWARTRDKASHDPIPIPLGYRDHINRLKLERQEFGLPLREHNSTAPQKASLSPNSCKWEAQETKKQCLPTRELLSTDLEILNQCQVMKFTPDLTSPTQTNTNGRTFELSTNLTSITPKQGGPSTIDVLRHNLLDSAEKLSMENTFVFQQDNDPKHTATVTKTWLSYHAPRRLQTSPLSPDLNPIENL